MLCFSKLRMLGGLIVSSLIKSSVAIDFDPVIAALISNMTIREKIGQMTQINIASLMDKTTMPLRLDPKLVQIFVNEYKVGSFLNAINDQTLFPSGTPGEFINITNQLQEACQKNRMKIPMIYGIDSVHGANYIRGATLFPHQLGLASTFNRELVKRAAHITAKDTRGVGIHWNFSPILDVAVNKQWPRLYETFGEDPYLVSELGVAMIQGYQGEDLSQPDRVAATLKHFIGYSATRTGRDVDGSWLGWHTIHNYFRPPFQAAIQAGAATVMESYSDIDGDHLVNSKALLVDLLRHQLKFNGTLITDMEQINKLNEPIHIAQTQEEAVYKSMKVGSIDISMVPHDIGFIHHMESLIEQKKIPIELVDINVGRVLTLKQKLGLLNGQTGIIQSSELATSIGSSEDRVVALRAARESIILLENKNQILPLAPETKCILTGPLANSLTYQTGGWTYAWQGARHEDWFDQGMSILEGLKWFSFDITYLNTSLGINDDNLHKNPFTEDVVSQNEVIILCLGETNYAEFEGNINDVQLPLGQRQLISFALETKLPVILVVIQGRPRTLGPDALDASAILTSFLPGPQGGQALAEVLFGHYNPSGRLPVTYSNFPNDNTLLYFRPLNNNWDPAPTWEFGYGLSYSEFRYSDLKLNSSILTLQEPTIAVSVSVNNLSPVSGNHIILCYITDIFRSFSAPETKLLKHFTKVFVPGSTFLEVHFEITLSDLQFIHLDSDHQPQTLVEAGDFIVSIGDLAKQFALVLPNNQTFISI